MIEIGCDSLKIKQPKLFIKGEEVLGYTKQKIKFEKWLTT
jgi:hypothetical protein